MLVTGDLNGDIYVYRVNSNLILIKCNRKVPSTTSKTTRSLSYCTQVVIIKEKQRKHKHLIQLTKKKNKNKNKKFDLNYYIIF